MIRDRLGTPTEVLERGNSDKDKKEEDENFLQAGKRKGNIRKSAGKIRKADNIDLGEVVFKDEKESEKRFQKAGRERKTRIFLTAGRQLPGQRGKAEVFSNQMAGKPAPPSYNPQGKTFTKVCKSLEVMAPMPAPPDNFTTESDKFTTKDRSCDINTRTCERLKLPENIKSSTAPEIHQTQPSDPRPTPRHVASQTPDPDQTPNHVLANHHLAPDQTPSKKQSKNAFEIMRLGSKNLTGINNKSKKIKKLKSSKTNVRDACKSSKTSIKHFLKKVPPETQSSEMRDVIPVTSSTTLSDPCALPRDFTPQSSSIKTKHSCAQLQNGSTNCCCCLKKQISDPVPAYAD